LKPLHWQTLRCELQEATLDDLGAVKEIWSSNAELNALLGPHGEWEDEARGSILHRELPPGGVTERSHYLVIRRRDDQVLLGTLGIYRGYPHERCVYIGSLFFQPQFHQQGYGSEVLRFLEDWSKAQGFCEQRLGVGTRNWGGLRFWYRMGYNRLTKISGTSDYAEDAFCNLELSKSL
jgi:GNAT superfamily N-acetyltransferase